VTDIPPTEVCARALVVIHLPIDNYTFSRILTAVTDTYPTAVISAPDREVVVVSVAEGEYDGI
jgi:hypothetical protein